MSAYSIRPAQRGNSKPLVGLYSESGGGKTWSSLLLARGFVGPKGKIGMLETEAGRGEAYTGVAPVGDYMVCSMSAPFSPKEYGEAITACEKAGLDALIIDSGSAEWEAVGGVLDMAAENEAKGWKGQIVWTRPKMEHARHFVLRLTQTPIPLVIVCLRAKLPLIEFVNDKGKRDMKRAEVPSPKQSEDFIYEMLIHGWLDKQHNFNVTKYPDAIPELKGVFVNGQPISLETGQRLKAYAEGTTTAAPRPSPLGSPSESDAAAATYISAEQVRDVLSRCEQKGIKVERLLVSAKVAKVDEIFSNRLPKVLEWIETR